MAIMFKGTGTILFRNNGIAMDPACCCGCTDCGCVSRLPDTLYLTVEWCGISTINLLKTESITLDGGATCRKCFEGDGVFGGGPGIAIVRLFIESACSVDAEGAVSYTYSYALCLDLCVGASPCLPDPCTDPKPVPPANDWFTPFSSFTCEPLYGEYIITAPPSACGSCMDSPILILTD